MRGLFLNPSFEISDHVLAQYILIKNLIQIFKYLVYHLQLISFFFLVYVSDNFMILSTYLFIHCLFNRYDIMHCRHTLSGLIAIPIAKIFNMKVISDIRGCYADEGVLLGRWKSKFVI